eukprot:s4860_g2.t1
MESDDDDDARSPDRRGNAPAGPPPPQPVNAAAEERDDAAAHGDDDEAAANAAEADDGDTDTRSVTSSDTPPVQRIKRTMVDELLALEKRQRREEVADMDLQAVADLGRRVLRGPYLRRWQGIVAAQPRWAWDPDAAGPIDDPAHEDLDDLVLGDESLRTVQRCLALVWRLQVQEDNPFLSQRQLGGRQGAFLRSLSTASWQETLRNARHSLRLQPWRRWVEQATLSVVPVHWRADLTNNRPVLYDKTALQAATKADDEQAVALQKRVQAEVQHLPTSDLHQLHTRVNDILCQAARQAFPAKRAEDSRVSANVAYRASARHVWRLYAAMKQPRIATAGRILQQWRNATLFMQASRALKEQSRLLKQAAFQAKLQAAEEAATAGDQRTLHSIVRSLTPSHRKLFSRLRNSEGQLLSKAEEARALADQGRATYALFPDLPIAGPLTQELLVTDGEITDQFRAVKAGKAVPSHIAPAGMWKLCSACLGPLFGEAFRYHFRAGNSGSLHGDLTDATMAMRWPEYLKIA